MADDDCFEKYCDSPAFKANIARFAGRGPRQKRVVDALYLEQQLRREQWMELKRALDQPGLAANAVEAALRAWARRHCLCGDNATVLPQRTRFGRLTTALDLAHSIRSNSRNHRRLSSLRSVTTIESELTERLTSRPQQLPRSVRECFVAEYAMWATFDEQGRRPFARFGRPARARDMWASIGLPLPSGKWTLILEYSLPEGYLPKKPTVADALAGDTLVYYFSPSKRHEGWGVTNPPDADRRGRRRLVPCPEVIHEPITGLTVKARRVRS